MSKDGNQRARADERELVPELALAKRYGKTVRTLQRWRAEAYGPAFVRIGGSVFYLSEDIMAFEARIRHGGGTR